VIPGFPDTTPLGPCSDDLLRRSIRHASERSTDALRRRLAANTVETEIVRPVPERGD